MALSVQRADTPNSLPGTRRKVSGIRSEAGAERTTGDERVVVRADVARAELAHLGARAVVARDDGVSTGAREGVLRRERVGDGGSERDEERGEERVHGSLALGVLWRARRARQEMGTARLTLYSGSSKRCPAGRYVMRSCLGGTARLVDRQIRGPRFGEAVWRGQCLLGAP
jgi:hypothetical protein